MRIPALPAFEQTSEIIQVATLVRLFGTSPCLEDPLLCASQAAPGGQFSLSWVIGISGQVDFLGNLTPKDVS